MNEYIFLMDNEFTRDKLEKILKKIEENDLETSYKTIQLLINYINLNFIKKIYNVVNLKDTQMLKIMQIYYQKEPKLYEKNKSINNLYINISERDVYKEDIIELLEDAEDLCRYIKEEYKI